MAACRLTGDGQRLRTRVLAGPLRGALLSLPAPERLSFVVGRYEVHVVAALHAHLRPGQVAYDVGAHIGYLSLVMARQVGATGRVVAFEPDPRNAALLADNLRANGVSQARAVAVAVGKRSGTTTFASFASYSTVGHIATAQTPADAVLVTVPVVSLDDAVYAQGLPAPHLIKIDVEGGEVDVLDGAERLLAQQRPAIICEVRVGPYGEPVRSRLARYGYIGRDIGGFSPYVRDFLYVPAPR